MNVCTVGDCKAKRHARGLCSTHYSRWLKHGDVNRVDKVLHYGDEIGTVGAHARVRRAFGSAKEHLCKHCGTQAKHWAYNHLDLNEKHDPAQGPFSVDPSFYIPLCVPCHKRFDLDYLEHAR